MKGTMSAVAELSSGGWLGGVQLLEKEGMKYENIEATLFRIYIPHHRAVGSPGSS